MVNRGRVNNLLLEDGEDSNGSPMTGATSTYRGTANANAIAINVEYLVLSADDDQNRTGGGNLGLPDVVAVLKIGKRRDVTPLGEAFRKTPGADTARGEKPKS